MYMYIVTTACYIHVYMYCTCCITVHVLYIYIYIPVQKWVELLLLPFHHFSIETARENEDGHLRGYAERKNRGKREGREVRGREGEGGE